jgi:hypothetical protein
MNLIGVHPQKKARYVARVAGGEDERRQGFDWRAD